MNRASLILIFLFSFLLFQCQPTENPTLNAEVKGNNTPVDSSNIQYLLFCKERKMELWTEDSRFLEVIDLGEKIDFPIGIYPILELKDGLGLLYPNDFYRKKLGKKAKSKELNFHKWEKNHPELSKYLSKSKNNKVFVFPNDIRKGDQWKACFACPHWMAELYGLLGLEMRKFNY